MIIVIGSSISVSTIINILKYYADLVINDNAENVIEELIK